MEFESSTATRLTPSPIAAGIVGFTGATPIAETQPSAVVSQAAAVPAPRR